MGKIVAVILGLMLASAIVYALWWLIFLKGIPKMIGHFKVFTKTKKKYEKDIEKISDKVTPIKRKKK